MSKKFKVKFNPVVIVLVVFIAGLLGVLRGQGSQIRGYQDRIANMENANKQRIAIIKLGHMDEVNLLKKVVGLYSSDIRENIKLLYKSQVYTVTSYSNRECETDSTPNITASNDFVTDFTIAVSRDLKKEGWTFGKVAYIEELGVFARIQDVMNKRFTKRIDVFNTNTKEAIKFGKKQLTVYLLDVEV